ncbi:MAG: DUF4258 domain-containing protein [Verrucomicrobiota bacterium]
MKPIRLTKHAREQSVERGATEDEVIEAIRKGSREPAQRGRKLCRFNFTYGRNWSGNFYAIKQVTPIIQETEQKLEVRFSG